MTGETEKWQVITIHQPLFVVLNLNMNRASLDHELLYCVL